MPGDFLDLHIQPSSLGYRLLVVDRGGRVVDSVRHYPWFTVYSTVKPRLDDQRVVRVERLDATPAVFNEDVHGYIPVEGRATWRVYADDARSVPVIAKMASSLPGAKTGLYNIRYAVRAALDLQLEHGYKLLGFDTPLALKPLSKLTSEFEEIVERASRLKILAFDIEVASSGGFPKRGDPILTISYMVFNLGDDIFTPDAVDRVETLYAEGLDEAESRRLVRSFLNTVVKISPDIIVSYNATGFDIPYMEPFAPTFARLEARTIGVRLLGEERYYPHVDLMLARDSLGAALGIRSHAAYALDDVAAEVAGEVSKYRDMSWLLESKYMEAERKLNHAKLVEYWRRRDPLFEHYIKADVYLTAFIARIWLYRIIALSVLTGIPPSVIVTLNTGQMAEYLSVEMYRMVGLLPELRERRLAYGRVKSGVPGGDPIYTKGKVYVKAPGVYGGRGYKIIELDFAQLYPTDMTMHAVDPLATYLDKRGVATRLPRRARVEVLLGRREKKGKELRPEYVGYAIHGYGPLSYLVYKIYTARSISKKLKKRAKAEKRPELEAPDIAVKILANSFYGAFSKERGNFINEAASAAVFWRTQRLLYDVIAFIESELGLTVIYGDTDSTYILAPEDADPGEVERRVNEYVQSRWGKLYRMELEGVYKTMIVPRRKGETEASAKSYIVLDENGRIVKIKGEFFKVEAPQALKERLVEFYERVLRERPRRMKGLVAIAEELMRDAPLVNLFYKKSVSSFVNDDDPSLLKRLNRVQHYAALAEAYFEGLAETIEEERRGQWRRVRFRFRPREVMGTQRAVIAYYIPLDNRTFILYRDDDGERVDAVLVAMDSLDIEVEEDVESAYVATLSYRELRMGRREVLEAAVRAATRTFLQNLWVKVVTLLQESPTLDQFLSPGDPR